MQKRKNFAKNFAIVMIFGMFLNLSSCAPYDPTLYPSYDTLNPGPEVKANPIAYVEDGRIEDQDHNEIYILDGYVVNESYMLWVQELFEEVKRLRGN